MNDDTLYIEFGENKGPLEFEDGIGPIALATTRLMAAYLVYAEVRDNPPASEVRVWPHMAKQDQLRAHGVALAPCIFYLPVRPPKIEKLHGFMSDAIKAGHLPLRERDTLYPFRLDQVADINGDIRQDGYISIADVWRWQRTSGVPTFTTAKALWEWCNPRLYGWYGLYTLPDGGDVEAVTGAQSNGQEATTFKRSAGRNANGAKQQAYAYYRDVNRQIEIAQDMRKRRVDINPVNMIAELMRLSAEKFPGSDTSPTVWGASDNFTITPVYKALGIKQKRKSERLKKPSNVERSPVDHLFRN